MLLSILMTLATTRLSFRGNEFDYKDLTYQTSKKDSKFAKSKFHNSLQINKFHILMDKFEVLCCSSIPYFIIVSRYQHFVRMDMEEHMSKNFARRKSNGCN